ncbi:MAG: CotH kinase family protein [Lachnospiraceae bacterium]|nr:CotH kinase family protein [Lachnospiraceae bacterium]
MKKHITKIIAAITALAVVLCILAIACSDTLTKWLGGTGVRMEYESELFNTDEIITIDIQMDEDDWNEMLANAMTEEYYVCDVVINGLTVKNVAIRPKGNTSLSAIVSDPDSDRYSLKLEFGHFVEGQTCYGLDKLILNNNYADATNMKEAIIYDMYQYIGADASLYNFAKVSLNGEYRGVYLALEAVEESFMLRNFGTQDGELYKPDSMEMGGDGSFNFDPDNNPPDFGGQSGFPGSGESDFGKSDSGRGKSGGRGRSGQGSGQSMPDMSDFDKSDFADKGGGSRGSGGGANLNYNGDDPDNYSTIWEGEITATGKADHRRVVEALKNISEGTDLEKYLDVDNVLKYMAVHTFAVNMDSLSGSMAHNYYLYEYDGQLNILPWDYNLSFGGMSMGSSGDATEMVNDAIDTPFSGTEFFNALLENEEYLERYHEYLRQLVEEYVYGGRFDEVYSRIRSRIDSLVETDPTAFYTYEEYDNAAQILYNVVGLRAQSIEGQLNGTIPSTDSGQRNNTENFVDASGINVKEMGQFNMGGFSGENFIKAGKRTGPGSDTQSGEDEGNVFEDFDFSAFSGRGGDRPSSFPGSSSGRQGNSTVTKNVMLYGICLCVMLLMLTGVRFVRRKRSI